MRNRWQVVILILTGLIIMGAAIFIYAEAHTIFTNSDSSRLQDFNRLLRTFGKTGTSLLVGGIGLLAMYAGLKQWRQK